MTKTRPSRPSPLATIIVLCLGSLSAAFMQVLVIPIQGELPRLLDTNLGNASWAVTATLLAAAITMPVTGRLSDLFGRRRLLLATTVILIVGSVAVAVGSKLAAPLVPFIFGRALQGMAMGYIPVAISMVSAVALPHQRSAGIAAVSATMGVGSALALPISAWIAQAFDWSALFVFSAVLGLVVLLLTAVFVPKDEGTATGSVDVIGTVGLGVGLSLTLIGVSKGSEWGWTSAATLGCLIVGLFILAVWSAFELRTESPLIDLRTFARRPVLLTNIAALLIGFGLMAESIVLPQLLTLPTETGHGLGQSVLWAGIWMAPGGFMMMLFSPIASRLMNTRGARLTLVYGGIIMAVGYLFALFLMNAPWQLMTASLIISAGVGLAYAAMPALIIENVAESETGSNIGVNALMRSLGTTVAGAAMAAVLTGSTIDFGGAAVPDNLAFRLCFLIGTVASLAGAAVTYYVKAPGKVRR